MLDIATDDNVAPALAGFGADEVGTLLTSWEADAERHAKARTEAKAEADASRGKRRARFSISAGSGHNLAKARTRKGRMLRRLLPASQVSAEEEEDAELEEVGGGANELLLPTSALVELPGLRVGFFISRVPRHALEPSLLFVRVTALRKPLVEVEELVKESMEGATSAGARSAGEASQTRVRLAKKVLVRWSCPPIGSQPLTKEMVVLDPAWARMCLLSAMGAEAAVRVQRRLHVGANTGVHSGVGCGDGGGAWRRLADRWRGTGHVSSAGAEARYGVAQAALQGAMPYHSLRHPLRLRAVWLLTVATILAVSVLVVLYSLAPCNAEDGEEGFCARRRDSWSDITAGWGVAFVVETLVDDPVFIMAALLVRRYVPVVLAYELCFQNAAVFCPCVFSCYRDIHRAIASCLGVG